MLDVVEAASPSCSTSRSCPNLLQVIALRAVSRISTRVPIVNLTDVPLQG